MKKIALLVGLCLAACGSKGGSQVDKQKEFTKRMCACKDKECGQKVSDEHDSWMSKQKEGKKPDEATLKAVMDSYSEMMACAVKLE
jgi:hypothetical protein